MYVYKRVCIDTGYMFVPPTASQRGFINVKLNTLYGNRYSQFDATLTSGASAGLSRDITNRGTSNVGKKWKGREGKGREGKGSM